MIRLGHDLLDKGYLIDARSLGRALIGWRHQIAARHLAHVSNGPIEAVKNWISGRACHPRLELLPELPDPLTAPRRQAQLGSAGHGTHVHQGSSKQGLRVPTDSRPGLRFPKA